MAHCMSRADYNLSMMSLVSYIIINVKWDFPGGPGVKTWPSNAGGAGSTSGQGAKTPHASGPKKKKKKSKHKSRSNIVTNSIKILK